MTRQTSFAVTALLCLSGCDNDAPAREDAMIAQGDADLEGDASIAEDSAIADDAFAPVDAVVVVDASSPTDAAVDVLARAAECLPIAEPGEHDFDCDGIGVHLSVPASCAEHACGLVLDVHGFTMSGDMEDANTDLRRLGAEHGYAVLQPSAPGTPPAAGWYGARDDERLFALVRATVTAFGLDESRVHAMGFSQGGDLTWRLLCAHSDYFASVAPASGGSGCSTGFRSDFVGCFSNGQRPTREIPVLYMHGRREGTMYAIYECAEEQRDAVVSAWSMAEASVVEGEGFTRTRWESERGNVFEMIVHDYTNTRESVFPAVPKLEGHCYPGSSDPGGLTGQLFAFGCDPPNAFHWGEEAIAFFEAHPRVESP